MTRCVKKKRDLFNFAFYEAVCTKCGPKPNYKLLVIKQNQTSHTNEYSYIMYQPMWHFVNHIQTFNSQVLQISSCCQSVHKAAKLRSWLHSADSTKQAWVNVKISTKCLYWMNSNVYNRIKIVVLYLLGLVNISSATLSDLLTIKTWVIVQHSDLLSLKCQKCNKTHSILPLMEIKHQRNGSKSHANTQTLFPLQFGIYRNKRPPIIFCGCFDCRFTAELTGSIRERLHTRSCWTVLIMWTIYIQTFISVR